MAITAISKLQTKPYVPECDQEEQVKTSFDLRPLDGMQYMEVIAELRTDGNGNSTLTGQGLRLAIKHGLTGWENFRDDDGRELKFNMVNMAKIPPTILTELAGEIISRSEIGAEERKN